MAARVRVRFPPLGYQHPRIHFSANAIVMHDFERGTDVRYMLRIIEKHIPVFGEHSS